MYIKTDLSTALIALAMAASVNAEDIKLEEVTVTAQRRSQDLQDVPVAISAFNATSIERGDLDSVTKLEGQVPALVVNTVNTRSNIAIRGIGSGLSTAAAESGVPINIDGVYMTRTTLQGAIFGDLQQIEVLRGPQGTLYGRNATGGTINIWTKLPDDEFSGEISTMVANANRHRIRGVVSVPISESLSIRLGAEHDKNDGHVYNITLDEMVDPEDHGSGRAVINWTPTDKLDVVFRANISEDKVGALYSQYIGTQGAFVNPVTSIPSIPSLPGGYTAGETAVDKLNIRNDQSSIFSFRDKVFSLTASYDMDWATVKSVTAHQEHTTNGVTDNDGTSGDYATQSVEDDSKAFTQEFTLSGGNESLDWVVGAWYLDDTLDAIQNINLIAFSPFAGAPVSLSPLFDYQQDTNSLALFGQTTYNINESFRVTAGLRYTNEDKTIAQSITGFGPPAIGTDDLNFTEISPKLSIDFSVTEDMMVYASVSEGFKAGGVNVNQIGNVYDPETLLSYEAGFKSNWLEDRLQVNVNAYFYDFQGYQANTIDPEALASVTNNATDAEVTGLELEFSYIPTNGLTLKANIAWADSEFGDFQSPNTFGPPGFTNLKGNELPSQAEFSGNVSALYEINVGEGLVTLSADHSFSSAYFLDVDNSSYAEQDAFGRTNIRASYEFENGTLEGLALSLFANNIEDELVLTMVSAGNILGGAQAQYSDPRTYGAELRYRF